MKFYVITFLLLLCDGLWAQNVFPLIIDTTTIRHEVNLYAGGFTFGNTLRNELTNKFIFGGFISDEIKVRSMEHMLDVNRFSIVANGEIDYKNYNVNMFGKSNWGMVVRGGYYLFNAFQFPKSIFQLGFQGNAHLSENSLDLSNTHFEVMNFQKIGFGIVDKKTKSSVVLNFVNGSSYYKGNIFEGTYRQSASYDSIQLSIDGNLDYNDGSSFSNGQGFALDADFRFKIGWGKKRNAYIQLKVNNLGILFFNHPTQHYVIDTTYNYSGFSFKQLMGQTNLFSDDFSMTDSLRLTSYSKSSVVWLPGYIQIGKVADRNSPYKWQSFFGVNLYTTVISLPQVYAGVHYQPNKWFATGVHLSYGGFGGLRGGIYFDFKLKNVAIGIATNSIYGIISKRGFGISSQFRLKWIIK